MLLSVVMINPTDIRLIIWDLDETLYYDVPTIDYVRQQYLEAYIKNVPDRKKGIKRFNQLEKSGKRWFEILGDQWGKDPKSTISLVESTFDKSRFLRQDDDLVKYFQSTQKKHVIVTNSSHKSAAACLTKLGLTGFNTIFHSLYTVEVLTTLKPDANILRKILGSMDVEAKTAISVGNSFNEDIAPAKKIGLHTCLICPGNPKGAADIMVPSLRDALKILD